MKTNQISTTYVLACTLTLMFSTAQAQSQQSMESMPMTQAPNASTPMPASDKASAAMINGEVRKIDKDAKKITIKHEPITNLNMPAMTMVFQVKDPALLDKAKAGDKLRFHVEKQNGAIVVTAIEVAQ